MIKKIGAIASVLTAASLLLASPVLASTVTVSQTSPSNWGFFENGVDSVIDFVNGPGTPPLGSGSLHFSTGTNGTNFPEARNGQYIGTLLSAITSLRYSTYVASSGSGAGLTQPAQIWLEVANPAVSGGIDTLVYDPSQNGAVSTNTWQNWNAFSGNWVAFNSFPFVSGTLADYVSLYPNTTLTNLSTGGGIRIRVGGTAVGDVFNQNVDAFTIGVSGTDSTYDFENVPSSSNAPTSMDQCKKGGWQNFTDLNFKNQGSCVSYVQANPSAGK